MKRTFKLISILAILIVVLFVLTLFGKNSQNNKIPVTISPTIIKQASNSKVNPSISSENLPIYDQKSGACTPFKDYQLLKNSDGTDVIWQSSVSRVDIAHTFINDNVQVGLRNKNGAQNDNFFYTIRIQNPDGTGSTSEGNVNADNWSYVNYPKDFQDGNTNNKGVYTVLYQYQGKIIICDGFVVE